MAGQNESSFKAIMRFVSSTIGFVCCMTLAEGAALAQSSLPPRARVVGRVFCVDTNIPARLATVTLQPLPARTTRGKYVEPYMLDAPPHIYSVMTNFEGVFAIEHVEPGSYYVMAEFPGYLNQIWQFTEQEQEYPTAEILDRIDQSFPKVRVDQGQTAEIEIQLQRGAALGGTIRYEDGSPATGLTVTLLRQDKNTKQGTDRPATTRQIPFTTTTDDRGHFRIAGLADGNVIMKCTLRQIRLMELSQGHQKSILAPPHHSYNEEDVTPEQTLDVYTGGVFREEDATPIKLAAGAELSGADIVIPLDKIYRVSGLVTSLQDDHLVNRGLVELLNASDGMKVSESKIGMDGSFHFAFVPKGEYQLSVTASDVQLLSNWSNSAGRILQYYEPATQPLSVVDRDLSSVVVQLKAKSGNSR